MYAFHSSSQVHHGSIPKSLKPIFHTFPQDNDVFLVPTLVTYQALSVAGEAAGMPKAMVDKVGDLVAAGQQAIRVALKHDVPLCYGSDLLGDLHQYQLEEFKLRSGNMDPVVRNRAGMGGDCVCQQDHCMHYELPAISMRDLSEMYG